MDVDEFAICEPERRHVATEHFDIGTSLIIKALGTGIYDAHKLPLFPYGGSSHCELSVTQKYAININADHLGSQTQ